MATEPAPDPTPEPASGDIRERLLTAAVAAATVHGLSKLSMGDVAREAGLSRQTLYRYFSSKDELVSEVVILETATLIERVVAATHPYTDPRQSLEAALLAALTATRDHPLLDRLIRTEPEALLPLLTTDGGPVMTQVRRVVETLIGERLRSDNGTESDSAVDPVRLRRFADIVTRLFVSYAVSAPDDPPEVVAASVAAFLVEGAISQVALPATM